MRYFLILLAFVSTLASCESDKIAAAPATEKKLIVDPTHVDVQQYDLCTLKVRLTNVPYSDVRFDWDLDGGVSILPDYHGWFAQAIFNEHKVHDVRIKAYDIFTNEFFDSAAIRVTVHPPISFVELTPDTVVHDVLAPFMQLNGTLSPLAHIEFSFKSSAPANYVDENWDWGDGTDYESVTDLPYEYHGYSNCGTFTVILNLFEKGGRFLGRDTSLVIIRPPKVLMGDIQTATCTDVYLVADTLDPVLATDSLFKNPFALRIHHGDGAVNKMFGATDFSLCLDKNAGKMMDDTIRGSFSDDFKVLRSLHVGVNEVQGVDKSIRYSFDLHDLELLSVTSTGVLYRTKLPIQISNLSYTAVGMANPACGTFAANTGFTVGQVPATTTGVFAVVNFRR